MQVPPRFGGKGQGHSGYLYIYIYIQCMHVLPRLWLQRARPRDYNPGTETRLASSRAFGFVPRMAAPAPSIVTRVPMASVNCHAWPGISGMGWRCAVLPRPHDGGTVQKRDRASIPRHRYQTA